jgi:RNA polymerase sigma factor (sigma-70 family)
MQQHHLLCDKELIHHYQNGSQAAMAELIRRYKQKIFSSIFFLVRDKELSEDIFQDTFLKVITGIREGRYNEQGKFLPWALRIAHNLVIDHFRREKNMPMKRDTEEYSVFDTLPNASANAHDTLVREERHQWVRSLLDSIPPEQREVVIMRHYGGYSFKEISEILEININTALGRMHYALLKMRELTKKSGAWQFKD